MNRDATGILTRHPANPILHVNDYPGIAQLYNPSPDELRVHYGATDNCICFATGSLSELVSDHNAAFHSRRE